MDIIELDASDWKDLTDFYDAILPALKAPEWHGKNINALVDSMVWGKINGLAPPYQVRIVNAKNISTFVREEIEFLKEALVRHRKEISQRQGRDAEVSIQISD